MQRGLILRPGKHSWSEVRSHRFEGQARAFLLAAFRIAGATGDDPHDILRRYADGLAAGSRTPGRDDAESRPFPAGRGQAWVEAASIALGLRLPKPWLWNRLDDDVRKRVAAGLSGVQHVILDRDGVTGRRPGRGGRHRPLMCGPAGGQWPRLPGDPVHPGERFDASKTRRAIRRQLPRRRKGLR
ncbi:DUF2264 domain-containing protein [Streptomyces sp. NPDC005262]|uniref:DUF2264 domain-containing protein n=1 Tax=Streptomyces sp. NPDC005262 TaxID=3364710 RepID=UPI0036806450